MESTERKRKRRDKNAKKFFHDSIHQRSFCTQFFSSSLFHPLSSCYLWIPASGINQLCCRKQKKRRIFIWSSSRQISSSIAITTITTKKKLCKNRQTESLSIESNGYRYHKLMGIILICNLVVWDWKGIYLNCLWWSEKKETQRKVHGKRSKSKNSFH